MKYVALIALAIAVTVTVSADGIPDYGYPIPPPTIGTPKPAPDVMASSNKVNSYEGVKIVMAMHKGWEITADDAHLPTRIVATDMITFEYHYYWAEVEGNQVVVGNM